MPEPTRDELLEIEMEGQRAYHYGKRRRANPYSYLFNYQRHEAWNRGYDEARRLYGKKDN